jgi:hypothetical protein
MTLTKLAFLCLKIAIYLSCFGIFFFQAGVIFDQYLKDLTSVAINRQTYKEIELPAVTLCPGVAFKSNGPFYNENDFQENSFELTDILSNDTIEMLQNDKVYKVIEVRNALHGRCHTIHTLGMFELTGYVLAGKFKLTTCSSCWKT